jgi:NitT/TauT family transport system substrate-binding protein
VGVSGSTPAAGLLIVLALGCDRQTAPEQRARTAPPSPELLTSTPSEPEEVRPTAESTAPLRIAYSDWPGWVAWQVAIDEHYFEEAGVEVEFSWLEYVPTIEAFSEGAVDAVCMTNGDALVAASSGAPSIGILINDYSNGNDMVVAKKGIDSPAALRNKRIAVEIGFVEHLLLMEALKSAGMGESDVTIINTKTHETPELLEAGGADAIVAWQPHSGRALEEVADAKAVFTSANVPGLIYDMLFVSRSSLRQRRADWLKVVKVWFKVVDFISDPKHRSEAVQIMARRVGLPADKYAKLMQGTRLLDELENQRRFRLRTGFESVLGSSEIVDRFNVTNRVYKDSVVASPYFDGSLVDSVVADGSYDRQGVKHPSNRE